MILALNGKIPEDKFLHYGDLKNKYNHTVCYYLFNKGIKVPEKW